jgi:hypothetical protein
MSKAEDKMFRLMPLTLVHGDYRLSNTLWKKDNPEPIVIDWQLVMRGKRLPNNTISPIGLGILDFTHLICLDLPSQIRKEHDIRLLRLYLAELKASGVKCDEKFFLQIYQVALVSRYLFGWIASAGSLWDMDNDSIQL